MRPTQLLRVTKDTSATPLWINPHHIVYAESADKKEGKGKVTILHTTSKEKLFVKESPEEINKIIRSIKTEFKLEI